MGDLGCENRVWINALNFRLRTDHAFTVKLGSESANIQFLTEYNAKQSIYIDLDKVRFPAGVVSGETPDVLILIDGHSPLMVSIEAKMYDTVSTGDLLDQLGRKAQTCENVR